MRTRLRRKDRVDVLRDPGTIDKSPDHSAVTTWTCDESKTPNRSACTQTKRQESHSFRGSKKKGNRTTDNREPSNDDTPPLPGRTKKGSRSHLSIPSASRRHCSIERRTDSNPCV